MAPREALPPNISSLSDMQWVSLTREQWTRDILGLIHLLARDGVAIPADQSFQLPIPNPEKAKLPALTEDELAEELASLGEGWEPWCDSLLSEFPRERQELRRSISFDDFETAMEFMLEAAILFHKEDHHPRWVNEWKSVTIRLSTWDAGNKITVKDVKVAKKVDSLLRGFRARRKKRVGSRFGKIKWRP